MRICNVEIDSFNKCFFFNSDPDFSDSNFNDPAFRFVILNPDIPLLDFPALLFHNSHFHALDFSNEGLIS